MDTTKRKTLRDNFLPVLLGLLLFSSAQAQVLQKINGTGAQYKRLQADSSLGIPADTLALFSFQKTSPHIAEKGGVVYLWSVALQKWIASGGGSGSGTVNTGLANRLAYYAANGTTVSALSAITANRALISDGNGLPTHSPVTSTELGYVAGATANIQAQLDSLKVPVNFITNPGTGVRVLYASDSNEVTARKLNFTGAGVTVDSIPNQININIPGGGSTNTFSNGITETSGAVMLGGTLAQNTTITGAGNYLRLSGGRWQPAKGASVTAANNLTLGNDGNTFPISGNTQINAITTTNWQAGSVVNLIFSGTPTVKHNTSGGAGTAVIDMAGDADWTAGAGDVLTLLYDGTYWHETTRKVAGSNGGRGTVTSVGTGYGLIGGPITSAGTLKVDTLLLTTRLRLKKVADSLAAAQIRDTFSLAKPNANTLIFSQPSISRTDTVSFSFAESDPLSVHLTDSAAMLNPYLRKADTAGKWIRLLQNNATGDSLIYYIGGTRYAVKDNGSGSGGGSLSIGDFVPSATAGSVFFAGTGGIFQQKNSDFFYDSTNKYNGYGTNTPSARMHIVVPSLGTSVSNGTTSGGIVLENTTAATAGNPQISPSLTFTGRAWNTNGGGTSFPVSYRFQHLPLSTGQTTGNFYLQFIQSGGQSNIGIWTNGSYTQTGHLIASGGNITADATTGENSFYSNLFMGNSTTGRFIRFHGGGGTIRAVFGHENTTGDFHFRVNDATSMSNGTAAMVIKQSSGNVLVNTTTNDNSAILNVTSTTKAFLPPRMTAAQRDLINLTVTSIPITNGGSGYTAVAPSITLTDPGYGGIRATAAAVISGGVVTSITILNAGSYTTTPTATVSGGNGSGLTVGTPVMSQVLTPGDTFYCTDCTATDGSTGVMQTWNGTSWKNNW